MRHIAITAILALMISVNVKSQDLDSTFVSDCKLLLDKGLLKEARDCYLERDTNIYAIYGAAVASKQLKDLKSVKKLSKRLLSKKYRSPVSYKLCASLYADDSIKYTTTVKKGLKVFKNDPNLLMILVNYYLTNKDFTAAIESIDRLIEDESDDNKSLYFAKGCIYQTMEDNKNALTNYQKAIDIDSNYFEAHFNIATMYCNQAADLNNSAMSVPDNEEYLRLRTKAEDEFAKAIPYLIKADEIKPDDLVILNTLKEIYFYLRNKDDYKDYFIQMKNRIDKINGE